MNVFLRRFLSDKKYILYMITVVFVLGLVFGLYEYSNCQTGIKDVFQNLFYINHEKYTNRYQLYLIENGFYIFVSTYLSTSYLGHLGMLFLVFLKSIQISFSLIYVFSIIPFQFLYLFLILLEMLMEIVILYIGAYMAIYLSSNVTFITFIHEGNLHIKNTLNYRLNYLIYILIAFSLSLALRIYFIPLFS